MKKIVKDANKWSITTRGFGERYPDKTLVLLDGRTLNWKVSSNTTGELVQAEPVARSAYLRADWRF